MKNRTKKLILSISLVILVVALAVTAVFAYNISVQHNYIVSTSADTVTYSLTTSGGSQTLSMSQTTNTINTDLVDVVLVSSSSSVTVGGESADITLSYQYNDTDYYKLVYQGLTFGNLTVSSTSADVICVAPAHATITNSDSTTTEVTYRNLYVTSAEDLASANRHSYYNDLYEYFNGAFSKTRYSNFVYLLDDVTISESLTLNYPCSINLLNSELTLSENLTLSHSYAGSYYIITGTANSDYGLSAGSISTATDKFLTIKTPKAYYSIDSTVSSTLSATNYSGIFDYTTYGSTLITDALDFAENLIPAKIYDDIILQPSYQTHGVEYSYDIVTVSGDDTVLTDFGGRVESTLREGALLRGSTNSQYTIRITATKGELSDYRDVNVTVIGTGASSLLDELTGTFNSAFTDQTTNHAFVSDDDYDLYGLLTDFYLSSGCTDEVKITISESDLLLGTDPNAVKLVINGTSDALSCTVDYNNGLVLSDSSQVTSLQISSGVIIMSDTLTVTFEINSLSQSVTCNLTKSTPVEVTHYLKSHLSAFVTSSNFDLLNLADTDDDSQVDAINLGSTTISSSLLGLTSISYRLVTVDGENLTQVSTATYFEISSDNVTLLAPSALTDIPSSLYLEYTCNFGTVQTTMYLQVIKTSDVAGDQQFESNNPFDVLFLSSETNWLIGGTFNVPADDSDMYAKIEILTVNGVNYVPGTHLLCSIANSGNSVGNYHKTVAFNVNVNYVPTSNTTVKVRCTYYDSSASNETLTQDYTLTIPGVYKCGDNSTRPTAYTPYVFSDRDFYDMTIDLISAYSTTATPYVSVISGGEDILLSDSSYASIELDYTTLTAPSDAINLQGLEKLTNVTKIVLDGIEIADMSAFGDFRNSQLIELSMSGCSLTNSIIYGLNGVNPNTDSYLYHISLETVDLSNNSISNTTHLLMRTVTDLDISSQRSGTTAVLTDISGLSNLVLLENLNLSSNGIYSFETITEFEQLTSVNISGNTVVGNTSLWGTDGTLNVPYYVEVTKERGTVIHANSSDSADVIQLLTDTNATSTSFSAGGDLTVNMQNGALVLNALVMKTTLYSSTERTTTESDIINFYVDDNISYVTTGIDPDVTNGIYELYFYDIVESETTSTMCFISSQHTALSTISGTITSPVSCSYVVSVTDSSGVVLASREFTVNVYYGIS